MIQLKTIGYAAFVYFLAWGVASAAGTAQTGQQPQTAKEAQTQVQAEEKTQQAQNVTPLGIVVEFPKNQAELPQKASNKVAELMKKAQTMGEIEHIYVATWSDQEFPRNQEESGPAKELAEKRNDKIKEVIQEYEYFDLDTFNMADKASWLLQVFNTDEAELKSQFAKREAKKMTESDYKIFKEKGGPGKSVVVVRLTAQSE